MRRSAAALASAGVAAIAAIGASAAPGAHLVRAAGATATELLLTSPQGDYIGQGAGQTFTPATASLTLSGTSSAVTLSVSSGAESWTVQLAPPAGQALAAGTYSGAQRYPFEPAGAPGLSVFGDGRGCNNDYGSFTVAEVSYDASGKVISLDATLSQSCESTTSPALTATVRYAAPVPVALALSAATAQQGQPVQLTATVQGGGGSVAFSDGATALGSAPVAAGGTATLTEALPPGTHVLSASYAGGTSQVAVLGVPAAATTTSFAFVSSPGDYVGQGLSESFAPPTATFSISGTLGHVSVRLTTSTENWGVDLAAPQGSQLAPGTYTNAQRYPFEPAGSPGLTVSGDGRGCNNDYGSFTVSEIGAGTDGAVTSLRASFTQECEAPSNPPLNGSVAYAAPPSSPPVALSSSSSSLPAGQSVTLTASLPAGTPGSVSYYDGGTALGSAPIGTGGAANLLVTETAVGAHALTALYAGDAAHGSATSPALALTVTPATTTTALSASATNVKVRTPITFTVTVASALAGATGPVSFSDGGTALGSAPLSSGRAALTVTLPTGTHTVTATYGGDATHLGSTSNAVTVTVARR